MRRLRLATTYLTDSGAAIGREPPRMLPEAGRHTGAVMVRRGNTRWPVRVVTPLARLDMITQPLIPRHWLRDGAARHPGPASLGGPPGSATGRPEPALHNAQRPRTPQLS